MMEHKRSPVSIEQGSLGSFTPKRHKAGLSISSKERKEKFSDRIAALQQLVSPFGKTDTASVLHEAMEYINFLHDQVKVLSAPYLHCNSTSLSQAPLHHHRSTTPPPHLQPPTSVEFNRASPPVRHITTGPPVYHTTTAPTTSHLRQVSSLTTTTPTVGPLIHHRIINVDLLKDLKSYELKSKGLSLVPISYTIGVTSTSSNGADIWAPVKTTSSKS